MSAQFSKLLLVSAALLLASCSPSPTRIALTIEYDDAWEIGLMEVHGSSNGTERDVELPARHALELWVPDAWAGTETRIRVRGLRGANDAIATGTATVTPVLGATTSLAITLHRVACGAWCTEGETRCFGDAVAICEQRDSDECMEWGTAISCSTDSPFCSLGQCRDQCIDECAENETRCDGPNGYEVCGNFDGDSCREWSSTTTCGDGQSCNAGSCTSGCRDQCVAGTTECRGTSIVTCGDLNDDGCTEWGPSARCATGTCEDNRCVEACTDECTTNECAASTFHECGQFDDDSCLDRSPGLSCTPADLCLEGVCEPTGCASTARECNNPPSQTCINATTLRVYDAAGECTAGDCNYIPRDIACPSCPSCDPCAGVTCNMPPATTCANASTRRTFATSGACDAGSCTYAPTDTACNTPPAATCANSSTRRTYAASGSCTAGACSYSAIDTACNTPPAATCIDASTLRTYMSAGTCSGGTCTYSPVDMNCPAGCAANACNPSEGTWTLLPAGGPSGRAYHSAVWTGTEMIVWGGFSGGRPPLDGGRFNPAANTWTALSTTGAPSGRFGHTAIWTGTEMIVWGGTSGGGALQDGGRFNPTTNTWTSLDIIGAPSARRGHTAIWTGTEMIVWGGDGDGGVQQDGGLFNPMTNTWTSMETTNAPSARHSHTAIWTGAEMIVWGGDGISGARQDGGRFNPATTTWTSFDTIGAPAARSSHSAVWTGTEMIVWGGYNRLRDGGRFNTASAQWTSLNGTDAPSGRDGHSAVWTGTEMIVWGGAYDISSFQRDGGRWRP